MSAAGYSGTPLVKKLGLRDGQAALLVAVPAQLRDIAGFPGFILRDTAADGAASRRYDYIHVFETERAMRSPIAGSRETTRAAVPLRR